jgi:WD40 repeat protein
VGCEDGVIRVFKVKKGSIEFVKMLGKVKDQCLSLSFDPENSNFIYAGYTGSTIRKWDMKQNNIILEFSKQSAKS